MLVSCLELWCSQSQGCSPSLTIPVPHCFTYDPSHIFRSQTSDLVHHFYAAQNNCLLLLLIWNSDWTTQKWTKMLEESVILDPAIWERKGCCRSIPPGLKNNEPENIFLLCTQSSGRHHERLYLATQITERNLEHWHKHSSNGFDLLLSLAEQDEDTTVGLSIISLCICTVSVPQAAGLLHTAWPVAVPRSRLTTANTWTYKPQRSQYHNPIAAAAADHHTYTHTPTEMSRIH